MRRSPAIAIAPVPPRPGEAEPARAARSCCDRAEEGAGLAPDLDDAEVDLIGGAPLETDQRGGDGSIERKQAR
ncbi:MAG: hypothetical protein A2135_11080 [Actinobacteria bacterium RBG_16_67_15]|nr:MAG: hypothetical protein A2135_11080 [Actinobacteria bacterium RBG_16_67_15]